MKIGLKRLRTSDLGWFRELFDPTVTKQKGFNIDKAALVQMFPDFDRHARERDYSFSFPVTLHGPGATQSVVIERKLLLQAKNWRLNGEFIKEDGRFSAVTDADYALIGFEGVDFPTAAHVIILSHSEPSDEPVLAAIQNVYSNSFGNRRGFIPIQSEDLRELLSRANLTPSDSIQALLDADDIEDAALGSAVAILRLSRRGTLSRSRQQLRDARAQAETTGLIGEELVFDHLSRLKDAGKIADFAWTSQSNAVALYDFEVTDASGCHRVEVKTTSGSFDSSIHISFGELLVMAEGKYPHSLYRVFEATEERGLLRVSTNLEEVACSIVESVKDLTERGIVPDSFTIKPSLFQFGDKMALTRLAADASEES